MVFNKCAIIQTHVIKCNLFSNFPVANVDYLNLKYYFMYYTVLYFILVWLGLIKSDLFIIWFSFPLAWLDVGDMRK